VTTLTVDKLSVKFGGVVAVSDVSFTLTSGVTGIIGPNGAGKSTLFNAITGLAAGARKSGYIAIDDVDISRRRTEAVARLGVRRTFQNIKLFREMTVLENVAVGAINTAAGPATGRHARAAAAEALDDLDLGHLAHRFPGELTYANQRQVEIARCLASSPKVLLLDEPAAGMHADDRDALAQLIERLGQRLLVAFVEHDVALVSRVCSRLIVFDFGKQIASGTPSEIRANPAVIKAYLGKGDD